jgi:hypothetical protein
VIRWIEPQLLSRTRRVTSQVGSSQKPCAAALAGKTVKAAPVNFLRDKVRRAIATSTRQTRIPLSIGQPSLWEVPDRAQGQERARRELGRCIPSCNRRFHTKEPGAVSC